MRIPIVFSTDENYIFYTCVAITSLARHAAEDTMYDISILTGEGFPEGSLLEEAGKQYPNVRIRVIRVDSETFRNVTIHNNHVTKATFYRLILSELLSEDKCIYLDSDIIVTEDLQPLFSVNLEEHYIAGCRDLWIDLLTEERREERRVRTRIPSMKEYVNGGVLVMNLRKIREEGINKRFVRHMSVDYPYEDQDIMNVCCYGKILQLPAEWNIFTLFLGKLDELCANGISRDVVEAFRRRRGIIHYATPYIRPWEHPFYRANRIWWETASEWAGESCYQELYRKVWQRGREQYIVYWPEKCRGYQRIIIFGFTVYGKKICDWLQENGFGEKLWFADNNPEKQGQVYRGIPVSGLAQCEKEGSLFINSSQRRSGEISSILQNYGINEDDILCYRERKDREYYLYLDECYYPEEVKDIFLKERGYGLAGVVEDLEIMKKVLLEDTAYQSWRDKYYMDEWILKGKIS